MTVSGTLAPACQGGWRKGQTSLFTVQLKSKAMHTKQFYSFAGLGHRLDSFEEVLCGFQEPAYPGTSSWDLLC